MRLQARQRASALDAVMKCRLTVRTSTYVPKKNLCSVMKCRLTVTTRKKVPKKSASNLENVGTDIDPSV